MLHTFQALFQFASHLPRLQSETTPSAHQSALPCTPSQSGDKVQKRLNPKRPRSSERGCQCRHRATAFSINATGLAFDHLSCSDKLCRALQLSEGLFCTLRVTPFQADPFSRSYTALAAVEINLESERKLTNKKEESKPSQP